MGLPYFSGPLFVGLLIPSFPLRARERSPGFCESFLLWLKRGCTPGMPIEALLRVGVGGALNPDGGRLELMSGDGDDWEGCMPLVWTAGKGGRFIFVWWGAEGFDATAVAIIENR